MSQPPVEFIDLTKETDITITLDDSFVPVEVSSPNCHKETIATVSDSDSSINDDPLRDCEELQFIGSFSDGSRLDESKESKKSDNITEEKQTTDPVNIEDDHETLSPDDRDEIQNIDSSSFTESVQDLLDSLDSDDSETFKINSKAKKAKKLSDKPKRPLKPAKKPEKIHVDKALLKLQSEANRANAANKALDNCTTNIDKNILDIINDPEEIAIKTLFDESMINYRLTEYPKLENSISWTYKHTEIENGACVFKFKDASWIINVITGSDYLSKLQAFKENRSFDRKSIKIYLRDLALRSKSSVILLVYNLSGHMKGERQKEAKNYRNKFKNKFEGSNTNTTSKADDDIIVDDDTSNPATASIGLTELQELRLMLQLEFNHEFPELKFHIEFFEKTSDIVQAFVRYSVSIAKLEVKQRVRAATGLDWALNMDKERAVDPTKSDEDLVKLWVTQLQQFSQITLPVAKTIAAEYPSPYALLDQYRVLNPDEAENLLAELHVQRNLRKQIGSVISKKVHCFMTCQDPDVHIGLS